MKKKVRLIFTIAVQDGEEHWSQKYATVDSEVELPEMIGGASLREFSFVGLEFLPPKSDTPEFDPLLGQSESEG